MNTIITSFTKAGYDRYGLKCLDGLLQYWPQDVRFVVYAEGEIECSYPKTDSRFDWRDIREIQDLTNFLVNIAPFSLMSGKVGNKYKIDYDARMGRKSFMLDHALNVYGGKVFWLDADTITHSKVPETLLDELLPESKMSCYLGRDNWFYTESGFLGYNAKHPQAHVFASSVTNVFKTGFIFTQPGWHDCYAYDMVRKQAPAEWFVNLAEGQPEGALHPFINSVLGAYMDHLKGPTRKGGKSDKKDLIKPRTEAYWNG